MAFHTWRFGVFLAIVLVMFWLVAKNRGRRTALLLCASYFFYGSWNIWFLGLIVFSTILDFHCGRWIANASSQAIKMRALLASLFGNLALLCYFKYSKWGSDLLEPLLGDGPLQAGIYDLVWTAAVPVGISFYTFQTLSYTIDIYRGKLKPARNFWDFSLFVAFFPQLVAGPIVRAVTFLPQLEIKPRFDRERLHDGLYRIGTGLVKKALLADILSQYLVDPVYNSPGEYTLLAHVIAMVAFTFQIYFDFSGYSDIAIGTARLFGFDLDENFMTPFKSLGLREFWRRWHISLSSWVRDYVYFPLGGSRGSELKIASNVMITMIIIGLWHGASELWLLYGLLQGGAMCLERFLERRRGGTPFPTTLPRKALAWVLTFSFVIMTTLCIRATSMDHIVALLTDFGPSTDLAIWGYVALAASFLTHFQPDRLEAALKRGVLALPTPVLGLLLGVVTGIMIAVMSHSTAFIYFQF